MFTPQQKGSQSYSGSDRKSMLVIKKYAVLNTQHENYDQSAREGLSFLIGEKNKGRKIRLF